MLRSFSFRLRQSFNFIYQRPLLMVGMLTALGALLRIFHLDYKSLTFDEAALYWISQGSFKQILTESVAKNSAPPLYAILIHLISKIGESEVILRSLSCLAGIVAIPLMYVFSRQFLKKPTAYLVTSLVVLAASQIKYSQFLREYSIVFLLATLLYYLFKLFLKNPNWKILSLLTLVSIISIFTQYGLALLILAFNLILLIELVFKKTRKTLLTKWIISQGLILLAAIVIYQVSAKFHLASGNFGLHYFRYSLWDGSLSSLFRLIIFNTYLFFEFAYPSAFLLFFIFCLGFFNCLGKEDRRIEILLFIIPMSVVFCAALLKLYPYHGARQTIFIMPIIYIFAGLGVELLESLDTKKILIPILILALILAGAMGAYKHLKSRAPQNIKSVIKALSSQLQPDDRIYIYYGAKPAFRFLYRRNQEQLVYGIKSREDPDKYLYQLDKILSTSGRVWLVFSHCWPPGECELIQEHTFRLRRKVDKIVSDEGAYLYLAH